MEKLKLAVQELQIASELIKAAKGSFVKRILARAIALRMHNLLGDNIFYQINKSVNAANPALKNSIKGDLNALKQLYSDFLQKQRHKFSGHFQDMKLGERIDLWASIDFTTANFFYEMPVQIYNRFSAAPGYEDVTTLFSGFTPAEIVAIQNVCKKHDDPSRPTMASDVLSLTRPNTGGLVHGTLFQNQCGALNSLELIIAFEFDLYDVLKTNTKAAALIKKLLVTDIINYTDNFFTRADVAPTDPQYYKGLDELMPPECTESLKIISDFKELYKLDEKVNVLRNVRDKIGSHIDFGTMVPDLEILLATVNLTELREFYDKLFALLNKVYRSHLFFSVFLVKNAPLDDDMLIVGIDHKSFDTEEESIESKPKARVDYNDNDLLLEKLKAMVANPKDFSTRNFVGNAFSNSILNSKEREEIEFSPGSKRFYDFEFRSAHKYVLDLLNDKAVDRKLKQGIIYGLAGFGPTSAIRKILLDSYKTNAIDSELERIYFYAFGEQVSENDKKVIELLKKPKNKNDFFVLYNALVAMFKIDIVCRTGHGVDEFNFDETPISKFLIQTLTEIVDPMHRIAVSAGLASESIFNQRLSYHHKQTKKIYHSVFSNVYQNSIAELLTFFNVPVMAAADNAEVLELFKADHYIASLSIVSEHLKKNNVRHPEQLIYNLVLTHIVRINWHDPLSIYNYSLFLFYGGDKQRAIALLESIVQHNPHDLSFYLTYLTFLKEVDAVKFEKQKAKLKSEYKLSPADLETIGKI